MIQVFLYHRDAERLRELHSLLDGYFRSKRHSFRLFAGSNPSQAANYLRENAENIDIYFLDYNDYDVSVKLSGYIRRRFGEASIVHIGSVESLLKTLIFRPSAFLADACSGESVLEALSRLEGYHARLSTRKFFSFKLEGEPMRFLYDDIDYFESEAKKVVLRASKHSKAYRFTSKLDDVAEKAPPYFLRCHQSYLVNLKKVRRFDSAQRMFVLESGDEVFISKRMFTTVKKAYEDFCENAV